MQQLALTFEAPALPVSDPAWPQFDRRNTGLLCDHELACLAAHGYDLIEQDATGASFRYRGGVDTNGFDYWRSQIDVLYLIARQG